jgi:CubicO group peptidase (beta-lactamase class C family)
MKKLHYFLIVITMALSIPIACESPKEATDKISSLEEDIDALIPEKITEETPGLVVGIVQGGEITFSKGYGQANLAYGIANNPEMVYNIGSVAKQFLGYAFAMLHVEGELNIDDPVSDYLENWPVFEHLVTLRHLLSHTSGYREAYTPSELAGRSIGIDRLTREECLNVVRKQPALEFIPGSRFTYNSTAWVILAEVLAKVTGESADTWVENNILVPLEMDNTQIESFVGEVIYNAAESYSGADGSYTNEKSNRAIFGAADIVTSVMDLAKWVNNYKTAKVGSEEVNKLFLDPYILNDGTNSHYALGIGVNIHRGLKMYSHTGGHEGFATQVRYYPEYDTGIILISNYGGAGWIPANRIAELVLGEFISEPRGLDEEPIDLGREMLEPLTGRYVATTGNRFVDLSMSADSLMIRGNTRLIPVAENRFRVMGSEQNFTFESNYQLTISDSNGPIQYYRQDIWNPGEAELQDFSGFYLSDELETQYFVTAQENQLILKHRWNGEIPINPLTQDFFQTEGGFYVRFIRNEAGKITGFEVNTSRTLNMVFQKIYGTK